MADGRIVLAGDGYDTSFNWTIASLRFLPDGQFDTTYNHTGFKHVYLPGLTYARSMKLQPDGKIIIGGSAGNSGFILRMNVNGSIDTTYGNMGVLEAPLAIRSMLLLPDGKIITGGDNGDWMVGRVKAVGSSVDSTFGRNGSIVNDINNTLYERINQIAVQQDNKIVAVGYTESNDSGRLMAIARYLPDATTKIQTISSIDKFSIYPNPATNELFIKCSDAIPPYYWACTISSIDGRTWYYPFLTPGSTTINISNLPPGTYTIAVHSNNLQYTQLFTKM
jgi:uncharacterized delta-60 repeat protein